jgi:hypothetical protein
MKAKKKNCFGQKDILSATFAASVTKYKEIGANKFIYTFIC